MISSPPGPSSWEKESKLHLTEHFSVIPFGVSAPLSQEEELEVRPIKKPPKGRLLL